MQQSLQSGSEQSGSEQSGLGQRRLSMRLAQDHEDLVAVQKLRWKVFLAERHAAADLGPRENLDSDIYDALCDHLLVIDEDAAPEERVVGTYRLLRESVARRGFGFYSSSEFDLGVLTRESGGDRGDLLELGRSCVLPPYRTSSTISLLWRGIAEYIARHNISLMFGCASFPGTDPDAHAAALSYLYHQHLAPVESRPIVLAEKGVSLERLPSGSYDERQALLSLPPLIKGYLRTGAKFGDGAYIDHDFGTVDVFVVMPVERISSRYAARFSVAA